MYRAFDVDGINSRYTLIAFARPDMAKQSLPLDQLEDLLPTPPNDIDAHCRERSHDVGRHRDTSLTSRASAVITHDAGFDTLLYSRSAVRRDGSHDVGRH